MEANHGKGKFSTFPLLFEEWMLDEKENEEMLKIVSRDVSMCTTISPHMKTLLHDLVKVMFDTVAFAETMELHSGYKLLQTVPQDIPVYLMSNYNGPAFNEISRKYPDLMKSFTDVIVSGKEGLMKPQKEIYELATTRWNLQDPSSVLYIDDDPQNIQRAKEIGFQTVLYTTYDSALVSLKGIIGGRKAICT